MKAIYYARVSTGSQSNERQVADIKEYCRIERIELLDTKFEEIEHGTMKIRPVLTELEKFIDEHPNEFDFLIVSELSRLGRTSYILETIENLDLKKIGLISLKENITTLNPDKSINHSSKLIISILTSINGYELETTKFRSISGIRDSIKSGNAGGSSNYPLGYTKDENKKLIINEKEAETIKMIFRLYLEGNGTQKICNIINADETIITRTEQIKKDGLNKSEYKNRSIFVDGTIYSILKNPIYTGLRRRRTHYEDVIKNDEVVIKNGKKLQRPVYELLPFPKLKIIEHDEFKKVENLLHSNYNKADKHNKYSYLLEPQKIVCGCCLNKGIIRHYFPHKREDLNDNRYMCLSKRYKEPCDNVGINIDKLEYIIQQIILFMFEDKLIEKLDDKQMKKQIEVLSEEIIQLRKELEKSKKKEGDAFNDKLDYNISKEVFEKRFKIIKSEQEQIEYKINNKLETKYTLNETYTNMKDIKKLKNKFKGGNKIPKDVVNKIISKITLTKQDTYPDVFKNKQDKVLELKLLLGDVEYKFYISQREQIIWYCNKSNDGFNNGFDGFIMNKFLVNRDSNKLSGKYYKQYSESYNKNLFDFFTHDFEKE